jgi:hypothetical protein
MVNPALVGGLVELAKMGLQIYLAASNQAGLTQEERLLLHDKIEAEFLKELETPLPEVPE